MGAMAAWPRYRYPATLSALYVPVIVAEHAVTAFGKSPGARMLAMSSTKIAWPQKANTTLSAPPTREVREAPGGGHSEVLATAAAGGAGPTTATSSSSTSPTTATMVPNPSTARNAICSSAWWPPPLRQSAEASSFDRPARAAHAPGPGRRGGRGRPRRRSTRRRTRAPAAPPGTPPGGTWRP